MCNRYLGRVMFVQNGSVSMRRDYIAGLALELGSISNSPKSRDWTTLDTLDKTLCILGIVGRLLLLLFYARSSSKIVISGLTLNLSCHR